MFQQILTLLNRNEWEIDINLKLRVAGDTVDDFRDDRCACVVRINPLLGDQVKTLIHECLHVFHPAWKENRVEKTAIALYRRLSDEQKRILFEYLKNFRQKK